MKLFYHPVSTVCRPIMLFAEEHALDLEYQLIDLFRGEQLGDAFAALNPSRQIPVLVDGDYHLTESTTILRYLAGKCGSSAYPSDLRNRARVDERLDWFNTGFYRDLGYGFIYPQVFASHRREDAKVNAAVVDWGRDKANAWLRILDAHLIGPSQPFVCGDQISIADYFGAGLLSLGEVIGLDYGAHQNVSRWFQKMKARSSWAKVHETFYAAFVEPNAPRLVRSSVSRHMIKRLHHSYFQDPNGYVVELTAKHPRHDEIMEHARTGARVELQRWQTGHSRRHGRVTSDV